MQFRTEISIQKENHLIDYDSDIILLGSCFAENIGDKLSYHKFNSLVNPYGILFHPIAIEKAITQSINQIKYTKEDLYFFNELWSSFNHHSKFSSINSENILSKINKGIANFNLRLRSASHLIITLGTAWVYRFIEKDKIVANCHKIPQKKFTKELLSIDDISESLEAIITLIKSVNKNISVILTLSPVRHLKDGFIENSLSKAHLLSAIHEVINIKEKIHYFPSYEIMIDELRDYRFYDEDMLHPNSMAIKYIWDKFRNSWMSEKTVKLSNKVENLQQSLAHRPFHPESKQHQAFLKSIKDQISSLNKQYPNINF
ncbi:MAG: GSCFA domain-containing protein [Aureibaculum sp.]